MEMVGQVCVEINSSARLKIRIDLYKRFRPILLRGILLVYERTDVLRLDASKATREICVLVDKRLAKIKDIQLLLPQSGSPLTRSMQKFVSQRLSGNSSRKLKNEPIEKGRVRILCKRFGLQLTEMRSPNLMVNRVSAACQSRIGMVHF